MQGIAQEEVHARSVQHQRMQEPLINGMNRADCVYPRGISGCSTFLNSVGSGSSFREPRRARSDTQQGGMPFDKLRANGLISACLLSKYSDGQVFQPCISV